MSRVVKVGSLVRVTTGDDAGMVGKVRNVVKSKGRFMVVVDGVALSKKVKKFYKPEIQRRFVVSERAIDISNVQVVQVPVSANSVDAGSGKIG